jgi:MFS family permease
VNRVGMMALPFLVLYLTEYLHISATRAGLAISVYGIGSLIVGPIAGRLADRIGPLTVMRGSLALTGVVVLLIPLAKSFGTIIALVFVWAIVADAGRPATMAALTGSAAPDKRRAAFAVNRLSVNLGMSVGPAVGGFLAGVSFPLLFIVDAATSLAAALALSTMLWLKHRRMTTGEHAVVNAERASRVFSKSSAVWRDRAALLLFATSFLANIVFAQHQGAMPLYIVRDLGFRESFYGGLFVLNTLIIVAIEVPLNIAMANRPYRSTIALAVVLIAIGFGAMGLAHGAGAIGLTVIIWTFGEMIMFPTATAYVAQLAPEGRTGEYMGAFTSTFSLALIVGPWMGTALLDRFGGPITWLVMLVIGLIGAGLPYLATSPRPQAALTGS